MSVYGRFAGVGSKPGDISHVLSVLRDPTRMAMVEMFIAAGDRGLTITALAEHFPVAQPTISRHVDIIQGLGVLNRQQVGQRAIYTWDVEAGTAVGDLLCGLGRRLGGEQVAVGKAAAPVEVAEEVAMALRAEIDELRGQLQDATTRQARLNAS